jgi:hypothetical protein
MTIAFVLLLVIHGLIHLMGFAKAFRYADLPALTVPIAPATGALWLLSALLFLATAAAVYLWPRWWWALAALAVVVSTMVIVASWADARFGMAANAVVLVVAVVGFFWAGPNSLRAAYEADVAAGLARAALLPMVTEADLAPLPEPIRRYLRRAGVVGQSRVRHVFAVMHGRIRSGPEAPWMPLRAEQHNFFDQPSRFFYMTATRAGVPIQGYHRYRGREATMDIRAIGIVPVVRQAGAAMTRAETVTLFNDMCFMAPATLIDPAIAWEPIDASTVRARYSNAGHTIAADLVFDTNGDLVDFRTEDRGQASSDGTAFTPARWTTPTRRYGQFGPYRLSAAGDARWEGQGEPWTYIEIEIDRVAYE